MRVLFAMMLMLPLLNCWAIDGPADSIRRLQDGISNQLKAYPELTGQQPFSRQLVRDWLLPVTDTGMMASTALGSSAGRLASAQTDALRGAISEQILRTMAPLLQPPAQFGQPEATRNGNNASVSSSLDGTRIRYQMSYLAGWKIVDIVVNDHSLLAGFSADLQRRISSNGIAQAVAALGDELQTETPLVRLGAHAWGPYLASNMPNQGLAADIVSAAFTHAGYRTELVFAPTQKLEEMTRSGELSGDIAAWPTDSERDDRYYTTPYLYNRLVFVKRSNDPFTFSSIADMRKHLRKGAYRLGLYSDVDYGQAVTSVLDLFSPDKRDYCSQLFRDVANKSLDLALVDQWAGEVELRSNPNVASYLTLLDKPLVERSLHVTIARSAQNAEQLVEAFNAGLDMIQQDGTYQSLLKQYNYPQ